ncbi:MAG: serine/threonine-protein kinase [Myxococcota bacterium]|nr:serine/threonine-protein kinase [Myxococcota bacterium]
MSTIPERIGRYSILERLAVGGMAVVYLGFETGDSALQRLVVIKQILPQFGADDGFQRMFLQEARLAANINHPNVVEIHELGTYDDQPFLAMEYVQGVPLNILMRNATKHKRPIPAGVAIGIVAQACSGAHAAHELTDPSGALASLVHRDLTPHNLMVTETGHVKILDFGVAKASSNQDKTETGMLKGKLPYMSPEQLWESEIDRRSDVFTLGVVLWEMLLGERLFARESEVATINAVLNSTLPRLDAARPDIGSGVMSAALEALEKDRTKRTATAEAFRNALLQAAREERLDTSEDAIRTYVLSLLGESLEARRQQVQGQIEKSINHAIPAEPTTVSTAPPRTATGELRRGIAWGAGIATIALAAAMYAFQPAGEPVVNGAVVEGDPDITIMLTPTVPPEILRSDLEPLRVYLSRELGQTVAWRFATSYAETSEALVNGEVDYASLPPTLYVKTVAANAAVSLVAVKVHSGSSGSDGILLVAEDGPIQTPEDIPGHRLCYTDPNSTTGYILSRGALRAHGIDPDADMANPPVISGNHLALIEDLIEGKCDIGGTFTAAYMNADEAGINAAKARVLQITGRTPHDAICSGPSVGADQKQAMRDALLAFDPRREAGRDMLGRVERLSGFAPVDDAVYSSVRAALDAERSSALIE